MLAADGASCGTGGFERRARATPGYEHMKCSRLIFELPGLPLCRKRQNNLIALYTCNVSFLLVYILLRCALLATECSDGRSKHLWSYSANCCSSQGGLRIWQRRLAFLTFLKYAILLRAGEVYTASGCFYLANLLTIVELVVSYYGQGPNMIGISFFFNNRQNMFGMFWRHSQTGEATWNKGEIKMWRHT